MHTTEPLQYYLDALGALVLSFHGDSATGITGAVSDSRQVQPGNLFVAITGAAQDGTAFVGAAVAAGARAVVVAREVEVPPGVAVIVVGNAYIAASRVAEAAAEFPARRLKLLGITGTNGKTTCAYLLRDMLRLTGAKVGMIGTVQYEIGEIIRPASRTTPTPFDLQNIFREMVNHNMEYVVMEVSSHALDQRRPGTTRFQAGLFTNLTGDHCDYHLTMENYFAAKAVLFEEYLADNAVALINLDDLYGRRLLTDLRKTHRTLHCTGFGLAQDAGFRMKFNTSLEGTHIDLQDEDGIGIPLETPVIGAFNAYNVAGTAALALSLGIEPAIVRQAAAQFKGAPGRLECLRADSVIRVFVDYAHTDDALKNVLQALRDLKAPCLTVVFGCGGDRDRTKRPRMGRVAAEMADKVYVTSDNPRSEEPEQIMAEICAGITQPIELVCIPDRGEAIARALAEAQPGEVVLVAGKGHEDYQEIKGQTLPFNDAEVVATAIERRKE